MLGEKTHAVWGAGAAGPDSAAPVRLSSAVLGATVLLALLALGITSLYRSLLPELVAPTAVSFLALVFPVASRAARGRLDLLEPIVGCNAMLLFLFVVYPIAVLTDPRAAYYQRWFFGETVVEATWLASAGIVSFVAAYEAKRMLVRRRLRTAARVRVSSGEPPVSKRTLQVSLLFMVLVSVTSFLAQFLLSGQPLSTLPLFFEGRSAALDDALGHTSEYLMVLGPLQGSVAATLIVLAKGRERLTRSDWWWIVVGIVLSLAVFLPMGQRRFVIPAIGVPVVARFLSLQRRPGLGFAALGVVAVVVMSFLPFLRSRSARVAAGGLIPAVVSLASSPGETVGSAFSKHDATMLGVLALEIDVLDTPGSFYFGRASLGDLVIAPIPGRLFPNKPETARNSLLTRMFGGPCATQGGLCPDFSVIGTFYQDLAIPGVLIGMAVLGSMASAAFGRYSLRPHHSTTVATLACVVVFFPIIIRAGAMPALAWMLYYLVPLATMTRIVRRVVL